MSSTVPPFVSRHRAPALLLAALALIGAATTLRSSASAQSPTTRTLTLKELDRGATFTHIRNTKTASTRANSQGDVLAFTNPVADSSGQRVGMLSAACTTTTGASNFLKSTLTCLVVLELRDGTLTLQANSSPGATTTTGAVTGGTGAYANARGVFTSKQAARGGADDTITLTS
jgi:hypothetical protein